MEIRSWDRDARIAVLVTVMFENWHEGKAPAYSPMTTPLREGTVDRHGMRAQPTYGLYPNSSFVYTWKKSLGDPRRTLLSKTRSTTYIELSQME